MLWSRDPDYREPELRGWGNLHKALHLLEFVQYSDQTSAESRMSDISLP